MLLTMSTQRDFQLPWDKAPVHRGSPRDLGWAPGGLVCPFMTP